MAQTRATPELTPAAAEVPDLKRCRIDADAALKIIGFEFEVFIFDAIASRRMDFLKSDRHGTKYVQSPLPEEISD